jgi:site-specific DNA-methyltransferase (adenine-specific)
MNNKKPRKYSDRKGTKTSSFGAPGRIGHDSSKFYSAKLYEGLKQHKQVQYVENKIDSLNLNKIFCKSSEHMEEIPDNSVHLMVTSPPYNVGKEYDEDLSLDEYRALLKRVLSEVHRVLVPGGRACVNVANLGRKPYIPLHLYITEDALQVGFLMRGEIIWDKATSASTSTAWGSWRSPTNPTLRDTHEYILVFCKDTFGRKTPPTRASTISRDEFLEFTRSVWTFPAESARKVGHPAPFPVELPYRLIQLYTFEKEVVLDPFVGSGATCIAALKTNRFYVAYDISEEYTKLAEKRTQDFLTRNSITQPLLPEEIKPHMPRVKVVSNPSLQLEDR